MAGNLTFSNLILTSNVTNYASIEFITQKNPHKVVLYDMVMFPGVFFTFAGPLSRDFDLGSAQIYHIPTRHQRSGVFFFYIFYQMIVKYYVPCYFQ